MINLPTWDESLIKKYNVSGPRYTSYPTALSLESGYQQTDLHTAVKQSKNQALSLYIHIPFCQAKCIYCDFYSVADRNNEIPEFIDLICQEIDLFFENNQAPWNFDTLFLGGGTPSLLEALSIEKILKTLRKYVDLNDIQEFTVETNPGEIDYNRLKDFLSIGVNRLSLGFQSFDDKLLSFLGRLHSSEDCIQTYNNARKAGFNNINADLIFDIPGQTIERWRKDLKTLAELEPEHISTYSLTVEKQTNLFKLVQSGKVKMPSETIDISMYTHSLNFLKEQNYIQYEISNHSNVPLVLKSGLRIAQLILDRTDGDAKYSGKFNNQKL